MADGRGCNAECLPSNCFQQRIAKKECLGLIMRRMLITSVALIAGIILLVFLLPKFLEQRERGNDYLPAAVEPVKAASPQTLMGATNSIAPSNHIDRKLSLEDWLALQPAFGNSKNSNSDPLAPVAQTSSVSQLLTPIEAAARMRDVLSSAAPFKLTPTEATALATRLANEECHRLYSKRPFKQDWSQAVLRNDKYQWGGLDVGGPGGFSAFVTFGVKGELPFVEVYYSGDTLEWRNPMRQRELR